MEKRFVAFVVASVLIMAGFMLFQSFFPKKQEPKKPVPLAKKDGEKRPEPEKKPGEKKPDEEPKVKPEVAEAPEPPPQWVTLGSIDPAGKYRMLVTLNNRGAAIERLELSSQKYLNLEDRGGYLGQEDRGGYLGQLALTKDAGKGCVVNVVGHGTPAALATSSTVKAGLLPGDVIYAFDGENVDVPADLRDKLNETRPKQSIKLGVRRTSGGRTSNLEFTATLARRPLEMMRPEFGTADEANEQHPLSMLLTLRSVGPVSEEGTGEGAAKIKRGEREISGLPSLARRRWKVKTITGASGDIEGVEFSHPLEEDALQAIGQTGKLEVIKRYRLAATPEDKLDQQSHKSYHLEYEIEIANRGEQALQVAYQQYGPTGLPLEGWWYQNKIHPGWAGAGARDVIWKTTDLGHSLVGCPLIYDNAIAKEPKETSLFATGAAAGKRELHYVGVDAQYFTTALIPYEARGESETPLTFDFADAVPATPKVRKDKAGRKITNVTFQLASIPQRIEAGKSLKQTFLLFAGPKEERLLNEYGLHRAVEYGWFKWVAWPLSQVLHAFYSIVGNYGIAIIMLTILVRGCLFPIGRKMAKNMQAMQDLAPEIKAIKEKYKDDMAKQGKAQQELFKKHKINPYAGCLPLFLQMPIFIGLYRALSVDISLRQAELIPGIAWASNLAGPDMLWYWKSVLGWDMLVGEYGYLGPYFNVFPLVTAGLFLVQQYLFTPPPTDEQQEMQQKMMYFMTIFMSIMFFKVPAGLCVYFVTSSLWGIAERTLMMPKKKGGAGGAKSVAPKKAPDKPGSNGATKSDESRKKQKSR